MLAVTVILLVVALISRFLGYLGEAVAGELTMDVLVLLIFYRLPEFLLVILPFALFLGILLAFGRMYADNEMTVLSACGMSQRRLVGMSLVGSLAVAVVVAFLSLQLAPWGLQNTEKLKDSQDELTEIDLIVPGQFQDFASGMRTTYAESVGAATTGRQLNNTFVAWRRPSTNGDEAPLRIIVSESARPVIDSNTGRRFMLLENGYLYDGVPGQAKYLVSQFKEQALLMPEPVVIEEISDERSLPTTALLNSDDPDHVAQLQWRISVILLIPILTLIAVPLSRVNPRQGRFSKLVPAGIVYAVYYVLLQLGMTMLQDGAIPLFMGLWWVHAIFLAAGLAQLAGWRLWGRAS
jgi:lipopolysaccharide export system permease protein